MVVSAIVFGAYNSKCKAGSNSVLCKHGAEHTLLLCTLCLPNKRAWLLANFVGVLTASCTAYAL